MMVPFIWCFIGSARRRLAYGGIGAEIQVPDRFPRMRVCLAQSLWLVGCWRRGHGGGFCTRAALLEHKRYGIDFTSKQYDSPFHSCEIAILLSLP